MTGSESATIAYHLLRTARRRGIDITDLEARFDIPLSRPVEVLRRLPLAYAYDLWEALIDRAADPSLAFRLATSPFPEAVALFVFVTTSRQTVREALDVLVLRSALITTAVRFELRIDDRRALVGVVGPNEDRVGARAAVEFLLGHLAHDLRCATRFRCKPRILLAYPSREQRGDDPALGPVVFGAPQTALELAADDLELPIDVLDGMSLILASRVGPPELSSRVRNAIVLSLAASSSAPIAAIAESLGLAPRTLQRHLPAGVTFQGMVQDAQRELALALVRARPDLPIKEIAARVGFASPRAFARAYRRWTGMPPANARVHSGWA